MANVLLDLLEPRFLILRGLAMTCGRVYCHAWSCLFLISGGVET